MTNSRDVQQRVSARYAEAARLAARGDYATAKAMESSSCGVDGGDGHSAVFGAGLYRDEAASTVSENALAASLGCGVPTAVAELNPGDVVLDLGSGAGADVLIAARRVAPHGRAIGLDMTTEMVQLARTNARDAGVENVEFLHGYIEDLPLADGSVDVVISNCVINLSVDKRQVLREAARVLRPGGRFAVSDVISDPDLDDAARRDMQGSTGCIVGALTRAEFETAMGDAGFVEVTVQETHRVHACAAAAIVRARIPGA